MVGNQILKVLIKVFFYGNYQHKLFVFLEYF